MNRSISAVKGNTAKVAARPPNQTAGCWTNTGSRGILPPPG